MEAKTSRKTKDRILEASLKLFNELGEPYVTTTTISEALDISPGNLYYHYRNKDDIIVSLFDRFDLEFKRYLDIPDYDNISINDVWLYLLFLSDFLWKYRFLYRDINELLARNRELETRFKNLIESKKQLTMRFCQMLRDNQLMEISDQQLSVLLINITVVSTYWLSFQFVVNPRQYNDQEAIRHELYRGCYQVLTLFSPYLRSKASEDFTRITKEFFEQTPLTIDGKPSKM